MWVGGGAWWPTRSGPAYANPIRGQGVRIAKPRTAGGLFEYNPTLMRFYAPTWVADGAKRAILQFLLTNHGAVPADGTVGPQNAAGIALRRFHVMVTDFARLLR